MARLRPGGCGAVRQVWIGAAGCGGAELGKARQVWIGFVWIGSMRSG